MMGRYKIDKEKRQGKLGLRGLQSIIFRGVLFTSMAPVLMLYLCLCSSLNASGNNLKYTNLLPKDSSLLIDYGVYTIQLAADAPSQVLMGVAGNIYYNEKYGAGQSICLSAATATENWQKWYISYQLTAAGINYYTIRNVFSGQLLKATTHEKAGMTTLAQSRVQPDPAATQLWQLRAVNSGKCVQIINKASGLGIVLNNKAQAGNKQSLLQLARPAGANPGPGAGLDSWILKRLPLESYRDDAAVGFFERNQQSQGSVAFDQGNTIALQWGPNKGKVLWVTQDAWDGASLKENNKFSCKDFFHYRNSVLIQPSARDWNPAHTLNITRKDSRQQKPKQICDVLPYAEFAWPSVGIEIGNHVYIQCVEGDGLGPQKSQSLYELTENDSLQWAVKRLTPAGMTTETRINYSAGMHRAADGYVYVFGFKGVGYGYNLHLFVARFPVTDPLSWTFWNGHSWMDTPDSRQEASIASGKGTASVGFVKGKYVFMTMDQGFNCDSARNIYLATAVSPTGLFTPLKKVYTITEYLYGSYARYYTPVIHPYFTNDHHELLLTYCLNFSACGVADCKDGYLDPYFYRIKAVRVPYSLIDL